MFGTRHNTSAVQFSTRPQKMGPVWAWIAIHPSGQQEEIWGFHSPQEAQEWRAGNGLRAWYRTRGYFVYDDITQDRASQDRAA
jgi:hypothetical protein